MKHLINNHLKNIPGWNINRRIIVFSVDDYGNVRLNSRESYKKMVAAGLKPIDHFDRLDTLETTDDLTALFEVLTSVKDNKNQYAKFTPFALPCNLDFESIVENKFERFEYETLTSTFEKLSALQPKAYAGAWNLWKEGMNLGIFCPQFHGREHLNLKVFNDHLKTKNSEVRIALQNRSYSLIPNNKFPSISYTAAFDIELESDTQSFKEIIVEGVNCFNEVFGYLPIHFNAPGASANKQVNQYLVESGIKISDNPFIQKEHLGNFKYKYHLNYSGKKLLTNLYNLNRNVVFEPCENKGYNAVDVALTQIDAAFRMKKPAIISSHRVNFCGHISEANRSMSLLSLKDLLQKILKKWPDAEFITSSELCELFYREKLNHH
jgi:hypothetical protein